MKFALTAATLLALFSSAFCICLFYARYSYLPIDHAPAFDGAWRILQGQIPVSDFFVPDSFALIYVQALFFKLFGVNWLASALNSSVFSGFYVLLLYWFFRLHDLKVLTAVLFSLLGSFALFSAEGLPMRDAYSTFYILTAITFGLSAWRGSANTRSSVLKVLAIPFFLALSYLDKPTPALLSLPLLLFWLAAITANRRKIYQIPAFICGIILCILVISLLSAVTKQPLWHNFAQAGASQFSLGAARLKSLFFPQVAATAVAKIYSAWALPSAYFLLLFLIISVNSLRFSTKVSIAVNTALTIALAFFALSVTSAMIPQRVNLPYYWEMFILGDRFVVFLRIFSLLAILFTGITAFGKIRLSPEEKISEKTLFICFFFLLALGTALTTNNTPVKSAAPLLLAMALAYQILFSSRILRDGEPLSLKPKIAAGLVVLLALADCALFIAKVHQPQHRTLFGKDNQLSLRHIRGMDFAILPRGPLEPSLYPYGGEDVAAVLQFFNDRPEPVFIFGDSAHFYGLLQKPSTSPVLWFHPGYTMPDSAVESLNFQKKIITNLEKFKVQFIVLEPAIDFRRLMQNKTSAFKTAQFRANSVFGMRIENLPVLMEHIARRQCKVHRAGQFTILELCSVVNR